MKINIYLIEYAINSILRAKTKNIFILVIFSILVFLLSSLFLVTNGIKKELETTVHSLPEIIVQKQKASRVVDIPIIRADKILELKGVSSAIPRVWGYYYFANAGVNLSIVGIEQYDIQYKKLFETLTNKFDFSDMSNSMIVGVGVKKILDKNYYKNYFNFIKPDGKLEKIYIKGVFKSQTSLESNDLMLLNIDSARKIFDIKEDMATDIVVKVANPLEISNIAYKIKALYPDSRVITKVDLEVSYENIFNYKSGLFLALFIVSIFTFFMIIYDKSSGLSDEQKKEIGILKALGWKIDDILKAKFYESFIISFIAFCSGIIFSFFFVFILKAPILRDVFTGYSVLKPIFDIPFTFDMEMFALIFFLSVPIYISATIFPSWRASTLDADEVIR